MFYCGIDIAKYKHEATVIDETGTALLDSISLANSKEGCEKLLALFKRLDVPKDDLLIGMEATGHYWLSIYGYLLEHGFEAKVINPIRAEVFRKMYIRQTKNDRKDSFIISRIMRFGQFSATNLSEETIVALRQLSRYRLALVDACGDCKQRVTQSGEFTGPWQKISKRGSPYLRRAIWLAASRAAFCVPVLSGYYQSLCARGKHHLTAVGAVPRKLCNIIFAILGENRPYESLPPRGTF
jgi:transposase